MTRILITDDEAKIREMISTGSASAIRMLAAIFAIPQVSRKARPTAFTNSQRKIARVNNSNIFVPFDSCGRGYAAPGGIIQ